jgi:DNA-binding XRE family transcriptional regulator
MKVITKAAFREFRKAREMTQVQMAKHMGVKVQTIRSWEQDSDPRNIPRRLLADPRTRHLAKEAQ